MKIHHHIQCPEESSSGGLMGEDFDAILSHIGTGKWNVICYIAIAYWTMAIPYHSIAGAFLAPSINHTCRLPSPNLAPTIVLFPNGTTASQNASTYTTDAILPNDTCSYLKTDIATSHQEKVPCTEWDFDNSTFSSTITSEFNLVCERRHLRAAYQSCYMGGILVGAFVNGFLADHYGRLTVITASTFAYTLIALVSPWLPSLELVIAFRFFLGTMQPSSSMTGYILMMEITKVKLRSTVGLVTGSLWAVGTMLWGAFAYLERDWRWLQTYVSLLCPVMLPFLFLMDESPRWLVVMGRHEEALSVLRRAARMNGTKLPPTDHLLAIMKNITQQSASGDVSDDCQRTGNAAQRVLKQITILFSTRKLITATVALWTIHFSVAVIYFGLTLAATTFNISDPFAYVSISGLMELPAVLTIIMVEKCGRKRSGIITFSLCVICLLVQPLIPTSLKWLSLTLVMVAKMVVACAFEAIFLYTTELYPTEIRTQGMMASIMLSRAGGMASPFILGALELHYSWATLVVFGVMAAIAAVCFVPLWETANAYLPDTIAQMEMPKEVLTPSCHTPKVLEGAGVEMKVISS